MLMGKIPLIPLKQNFTPNTLGCHGLNNPLVFSAILMTLFNVTGQNTGY